ncbi:MAG: DNA methylase, partial [Candidatus Marsarchaeota archaeon]|nr:DNA methylase [Candidatus Marsarchaeota archaeon]
MNYLLFDRMVAFHVQRGLTVSLSASEFYVGLKQRFPMREGMYFLSDQAVEYDRKRLAVSELLQLELAPSDEPSAIQWLRQQLERKPQTFQELHPQFTKAIAGWIKHEKPLELSELLDENFLRYEGKGDIPDQIWQWMRQEPALKDKVKGKDPVGEDDLLRAEAKGRWYVPDPNNAQDLEAIRAGFKKAWQERDYRTIIDVAQRISEEVLQEDPKLLMWYDQAMTRMGGEGSLL